MRCVLANLLRLAATGARAHDSHVRWLWWLFLVSMACGRRPEPTSPAAPAGPARLPKLEAEGWPAVTQSPHPLEAAPGAEPLQALCAPGDAALQRVAHELAREATLGRSPLAGELEWRLRAQGAPYVWPRMWTLTLPAGETADARERMSVWLGSLPRSGPPRCGVARHEARTKAQAVIAALSVDVLADLSPLPTRVPVGTWLEVEARILVPYQGAKIVVVGPRGTPKLVPTSVREQHVRGRFAIDAAGHWVVQVLAEVSGGPRPVLEAWLFADVEPPSTPTSAPAPGEAAAKGAKDPRIALERMLEVTRRSEGLATLRRDAGLDEVAQQQAEAMQRAGRLAHDLGDDPARRLETAGLRVTSVGENVAHATSATHAHRAMWASPSHRFNLVSSQFAAVGIGAVQDADGSLWVCELFASFEP